MEPQVQSESKKGMLWLIVGALVIIGIVYAWMMQVPEESSFPETAQVSTEDTTDVIEQELSATDFGDLETDVQAIDADINSL
ncbi:MAG: hypothetical protein Q8R26_00410 [bacterium]|nr:hypothetical protein [bacterium]